MAASWSGRGGESWDAFVRARVDSGWVGVESLAGIPGLVGATPIQNVGAYGQEVSQTVASVRVWDRVLKGVRTFANADCRFGYRTSRFKADPAGTSSSTSPSSSARAASAPRCSTPSWPAPSASSSASARRWPRSATPSSGCAAARGWCSTRPTTTPGAPGRSSPTRSSTPPTSRGAPAWPQPDGRVKTSAAWLIERAGFGKGYGAGPVTLSTKHTLALSNRGGATTEQLLALAREVRDGVEAAHGIRLVTEPVLVGCRALALRPATSR